MNSWELSLEGEGWCRGKASFPPVITPSPAPCGRFDLVSQVWKRGIAVQGRRVCVWGGGAGGGDKERLGIEWPAPVEEPNYSTEGWRGSSARLRDQAGNWVPGACRHIPVRTSRCPLLLQTTFLSAGSLLCCKCFCVFGFFQSQP